MYLNSCGNCCAVAASEDLVIDVAEVVLIIDTRCALALDEVFVVLLADVLLIMLAKLCW